MTGKQAGIVTKAKGKVLVRASAWGTCERELAMAWMGIMGTDRPDKLQAAMDQSSGLEPRLIEMLQGHGYRVSSPQMEVTLPLTERVVVVGHLDGLARKEKRNHVAEVKAFGDDLYAAASPDVAAWSTLYAWQIAAYMHATGLPAVLGVGLKKVGTDGAVDIIDGRVWEIETPPVPLEEMRQKALRLEDYVARLTKPREIPCAPRWGCPLFPMGYCDTKPRPEAVRELEVEEWATAYDTARARKKDAEAGMAEAHGELVRLVGDRAHVEVAEFGVAYTETKKREWDKEAVRLALKNCGHDPRDYEVERVQKVLRVVRRGD